MGVYVCVCAELTIQKKFLVYLLAVEMKEIQETDPKGNSETIHNLVRRGGDKKEQPR